MISDLALATSSQDLPGYYQALRALHAEHHQPAYLLVHEELRARLVAGCESYTEMGVNQGATLAAALLLTPPRVRAYDISLANYRPAQHLFEGFAAENAVDFAVLEADSLRCWIGPTDLLYIDTRHERKHLARELARHECQVRRYIVCHDTHSSAGLRQAVEEFAERNHTWRIVADCRENKGFMTLARIH